MQANVRRGETWAAAFLLAALALTGCSQKQKPPSGMAPAQEAAKTVQQETKAAANAVKTAAKNPESTASDLSITSKVKSAFGLDKVLDGTNINVTTNNGVVLLEGTVSSQAQSAEAARAAKNIDGVKSVTNKLKVGAAAAKKGG